MNGPRVAILASAIALATIALPQFALAENALTCAALPGLMDRYLERHVSGRAADKELLDRVAKIYVDRIDPSKVYLTPTRAKQLRAMVSHFAKKLHDGGDCQFLVDVKKKRLKWQHGMADFVKKTMANDKLVIDRSVELGVDPDDRDYPATPKARDELRRKLIHFQLANYVASGTKLSEARKKMTKRYALIIRRIEELTPADLYSNFLNAFANALDPHSTYFSADALEDFRIGMALSLEGIGAVLSSRDGYTTVTEVVKGGAADRQGQLKAKDKIIAVAQGRKGEAIDVVDMALRKVVRKIRGKKGTKVKLTVLRQGEKNRTLNIVIVRDKIDLKEQAAQLTWHELKRKGKKTLKLARLELPSFYGGRGPGARNCTEDVRKLLVEVEEKKADGLLLDLAQNSGGLLDASVQISGFFLRRGAVVGVEGSHGSDRQILDDLDDRVQFAGPMVVLTSRASASASEILAGAIKDYHRGVLVGDTQTFGKGTVQNVVNLAPGFGALKVTSAMFFRPGGASTQAEGVKTDIRVPSLFDSPDYGESQQDYALPHRETVPFLSPSASGAWTPIKPAVIQRLRALSSKRVNSSKEFDKVKKKLATEGKNKMVKVAEILDESNEKEDKTKDASKDKDKDKLSIQATEALEILADLVTG